MTLTDIYRRSASVAVFLQEHTWEPALGAGFTVRWKQPHYSPHWHTTEEAFALTLLAEVARLERQVSALRTALHTAREEHR